MYPNELLGIYWVAVMQTKHTDYRAYNREAEEVKRDVERLCNQGFTYNEACKRAYQQSIALMLTPNV